MLPCFVLNCCMQMVQLWMVITLNTFSGCFRSLWREQLSSASLELHTGSLKVKQSMHCELIYSSHIAEAYCHRMNSKHSSFSILPLIHFTVLHFSGVVKRIIPAVASTNAVIAGTAQSRVPLYFTNYAQLLSL